jgi:hypothetical protein
MTPMLAHIVGSGSPWQLWITAGVMFGGAVAAMFARQRWHRACVTLAVVGGIATILVYVLIPGAPAAPAGLSVHIAAPVAGATVTSPVLLRVCDGATSVPGAGRLLDISVDGRLVAEVSRDTASITAASGEHTVRAELVTSAHREYAPPVVTEETIAVSGVGPLSPPPDCSGAPAGTP